MRAWQISIMLNFEINAICSMLPDSEKFSLTSQIRRAALSVTNNIAEGASRKSAIERRRFYEIARSSLVEVDNCIEVILNLKYIDSAVLIKPELMIEESFRILTAMIRNT